MSGYHAAAHEVGSAGRVGTDPGELLDTGQHQHHPRRQGNQPSCLGRHCVQRGGGPSRDTERQPR